MKNEIDERIASLLNAGASPERDPVFRIKVLERRERQRFQRQLLAIIFSALILVAVASSGYLAGAKVAEAASVALLCVALASLLVCLPVVANALRRRALKGGPPPKS